jgi:TonB family protein
LRVPVIIAALVFAPAVYCQNGSDLIQKYEQQIQANPANSRAHYELGEIYLEQGGYIKAASEYRAALNGDLEPKLIEVLSHLGLAKVFERSGQAERAANEREQATRAARDNPRLAEMTSTRSDSVQPSTSSPSAPRPRLLSPIVLTPPIRQTEPEYSDEARAAGLEGTIQVSLNIAPDGTAVNEKVLSPLGLGLDEKAIECVRRWRFALPAIATLEPVTVAVNFLLPRKVSRWHLVNASFDVPDRATRPAFHVVPYPLGAGVSNKAIDEGWVISAIPRAASVRLQFEVNERGAPAKFQVLDASADLWGNEAIAVVRRWRFTPGTKDGKPVAVPCTVDLVWGQKTWTPEILARVHDQLRVAATPESSLGTPTLPTPPSLMPIMTAPPARAMYFIDDPQRPHDQICVILNVVVGLDGALGNLRVVRSLGYAYDSEAIDAVRARKLITEKPHPGLRYIEVDFVGH